MYGTEKPNPWETIDRRSGEVTSRLRVDNGWIYRTIAAGWSESSSPAIAMVFVPDKEH